MSQVHTLIGSGGTRLPYPEFTYTGSHAYLVDGNTWQLKLLTSGTLRFKNIKNANLVDVFLVGGGGGGSGGKTGVYWGTGGGGGYTASFGSVPLSANTDYEIIIGAGGAGGQKGVDSSVGADGGITSAFGHSVNGGKGGYADKNGYHVGGNGGSGGSYWGCNGGTDGSDGGTSSSFPRATRGIGQHTSTREFYSLDYDSSAELYSNGGPGGDVAADSYIPRENFGDGGGGGHANDYTVDNPGSAGVVIVRPHV